MQQLQHGHSPDSSATFASPPPEGTPCPDARLDYSTEGPPPKPLPTAGAVAGEAEGLPPGEPSAGDPGGVRGGGPGPDRTPPRGGDAPVIRRNALAEAVQRAQQIAAKIGGDAATTVSNNTPDCGFQGQKRKLKDGHQPESKKLAAQGDSLSPQLGPIQPPPRSSMTEEYRVPNGMMGLIIGRGGDQINKIQQDSGCKVKSSPDRGGLPERRVSLTEAPESVQKAKMVLDEIVSRGPRGPPGEFHDHSKQSQNGTVQEIMIPTGKAGLVIGKGGETIKQLQEQAGVKMILIQNGSQNTNVDKHLQITGNPYKVQQACELVMDILQEPDQGGFGDWNEYGSRIGGGIDVPVPRHSIGVVIGPGGEMIKKIQSDAGVQIQVKQDDGKGSEKIIHIMGPPDRCKHAAQIISDLLQSLRSGPPGPPGDKGMPSGDRARGRGQGNWGPPGGEMTLSIPAHKCGLVIGRGGKNVKAINQQTGAFVEISRQLPPNGDPNFKLFVIRGSPQQIHHAKQLIEEKIKGPLCPVGPGPGALGPAGPMERFNPGPFNQRPPGAPSQEGGPPPHQHPPQGWGTTYPQWQPPAPHDPNIAAAVAAYPNATWAGYYSRYYPQPPGPMPGPAPAPMAPPAWGEPPQLQPTTQSDYTKALEEYYQKISQKPQQPTAYPQQDYTKTWEEYYKKQAQVATGGGPGAPLGSQLDSCAAWAKYYGQQATYYGQTPSPGGPSHYPHSKDSRLNEWNK